MNSNIITSETELFKKNLCRSYILECKINGINLHIKKYRKLLIFVYTLLKYELQSIEVIDVIIKNSLLVISQKELKSKGYQYYDSLGLSIRCADSKKTLREILNILKQKKENIELKLQLANGEIVYFVMLSRFNYIMI